MPSCEARLLRREMKLNSKLRGIEGIVAARSISRGLRSEACCSGSSSWKRTFWLRVDMGNRSVRA